MADIQGEAVTGTARYYTHDNLGSTRTLRSQAKAALARFDYDPYGSPTYHDGASATRTYTGHDLDPVKGMYFAPFRYYAPGLARWTARDPIECTNSYIYVGDSPIVFADLRGDKRKRMTKKDKLECLARIKMMINMLRFANNENNEEVCDIPDDLSVRLRGFNGNSFSPWKGTLYIDPSACSMSDAELALHLLHEIGHAQDSYPRPWRPFYPFSYLKYGGGNAPGHVYDPNQTRGVAPNAERRAENVASGCVNPFS